MAGGQDRPIPDIPAGGTDGAWIEPPDRPGDAAVTGRPAAPEPGDATTTHRLPAGQAAGDDGFAAAPAARGSGDVTEPLPPRWTGSAPVPPPRTARRRRGPAFDDDVEDGWEPLTEPAGLPPAPDGWPAVPGLPDPTWPDPRRYGQPDRHQPRPDPYRRDADRYRSGRSRYRTTPPRRRGRRWPRVLLTLSAVTMVCCGGCLAAAMPYLRQWPATVKLTPQVAGLRQRTDPRTRIEMATLAFRLRTGHLLARNVFAAVYAQPGHDDRDVTLFGAAEFIANPGRSLDGALGGLPGGATAAGVHDVPAGPLGGYQRCGTATVSGDRVVVCGWADHGSVAVGLFAGRDERHGAALLREVRAAVLHRTFEPGTPAGGSLGSPTVVKPLLSA